MRVTLLLVMAAMSHALQSCFRSLTTTTSRVATLRQLATSSRSVDGDGEGITSTTFWTARTECWRPTVNDVERISWGKPAKKKGTGSRGTPHRLNADERIWFDQARRRGFLEVPGSGWRSQRREAPLLNSYRSLCDARGQACIVLHKGNTGIDELVLDLSPLRLPETFPSVAEACVEQVGIPSVEVFGDDSFGDSTGESDGDGNSDESLPADENDPWESRPIYQLPPFFVSWELQRSVAKEVGKTLAGLFQTVEPNVAKSKKPVGVKHGKGRRHGGYGIG